MTAGVVFVVVAFLVAAAAMLRRARGAAPAVLRHLSRLWSWTGFVLAAVPSTVWLVLWLSGGQAKALAGLGGLVLSAAPVLAGYRFPRLVPVSLALCLLVSLSIAVAWDRLVMLLPLSLALTGVWLLALVLHLRSTRADGAGERRETPVQRRNETSS
ncbi:hypothetical protein [Amycolatopsis thermophila]|uniref:Uncharacterized protein n=1 Tax=Amycolatopsis thermophila TaxID=206084 RepID=A0ABU0EU99_9PSEU|nr:hypothetical protein [Amycolatopsis thermophila]MDQ0378886.1 hypothetical protein [Amycolatopsis thermophila]